ncbi:MAG: TonB family protein, partial [Deltaproteobacteria bacterium]|nr:TonB family protein [Deltaproteobacteria bacterium]
PARAHAPAPAAAPAAAAPPPTPAPAGTLTKPPELIAFVDAPYPESAKATKEQAAVVLLLTLSEAGAVTDVSVQESSGSAHPFDAAAVEAARGFRFSPAEVDGAPAPVQISFRYEFTLQEEVVRVEEAREVGRLRGVVLERGTRRPLAGVTVRLTDRALTALTDAEGAFSFDALAPGKVSVEIDDEAFYTLLDREEVTAKRETETRYYLEPKGGGGDELTVIGRRAKKEVVQRTLTVEEIRKIPGTQGDALKVVQNLPGVARVPFGGGGLVVRGSNPGDSGSMINRHFIPIVFHFGGIRSIFPSELLESIDFYPGNFSAEFGRFSGGVIDARFRRPLDDRLHARVEADVFDAGFLLEGPLTRHLTFALSGRRSYVDAILPFVLGDDAALDFVVAPRYYDYQALLDYKRGAHRVRLYFFGTDDELRFVLDEPVGTDASVRGSFRNATSLARVYAAWDYKASDALSHHVSVAAGKNKLFFALSDSLFFDNDVNIVTFRDELTWQASEALSLRVGLDVEAYLGDISLRLPQPTGPGASKEGGGVGGGGAAPLGTLKTLSTASAFQFYSPGLWLEAQWRPTPRLTLSPGARVDYESVISDVAPDPRLNATYALALDEEGKPTRALKLGVGRYSQRPFFDEVDKTFGNPDLNLEHSAHFSLAYEQRFADGVELDVTGFYKQLYSSVSPISDPLLKYDNNGAGRVGGLEVLLKKNLTSRFFGWVSYTLMRSERKGSEDKEYRLFSQDQTHILTLIAQYKLTSAWEVGARYRYTTGNPRTPIVSSIYDADANVYVPVQGALNSERLNAFQQLDLRVDRKWRFDSWILTAYFEIQNALNQSNPEGIRYNYNFTQQKAISGLPIIPSLGLRGEL